MATRTEKVWLVAESGITVKRVRKGKEQRVHICGKRGEVLSLNLDDLYDLTDVLDDVCDELEDENE